MFKQFTLAAMLAGACTLNIASAAEAPAGILASIGKLMPGLTAKDIQATPMPGLFQVTVGPNVIYVSEDGRYMLRGDLIDIQARRNLSRAVREKARVKAIDGLGQDSMIVFEPAQLKHTVTVFTDVDCGYCRRMHQQIPDYNALGIEVRYTAFPRSGIPSPGYDKMVSVWCADDPREAMTQAKQGRRVAKKQCDNPVSAHYRLAEVLGIEGTPTIFTETGRMLPGYVPPKRLLKILEQDRPG